MKGINKAIQKLRQIVTFYWSMPPITGEEDIADLAKEFNSNCEHIKTSLDQKYQEDFSKITSTILNLLIERGKFYEEISKIDGQIFKTLNYKK